MNKATVTIIALLIVVAGLGGYVYRGQNNSKDTTTTQDTTVTTPTVKTSGKTADYSGKGLTAFPKDLLKDKSITVLDLSNNDLTGSIPGEIHDLTNLVELNLSNNRMTGIPAEVGQLRKLKILNYANNNITGLPNELGNLTQLEILDLSGNNVSQQDLNGIRSKLLNTKIIL